MQVGPRWAVKEPRLYPFIFVVYYNLDVLLCTYTCVCCQIDFLSFFFSNKKNLLTTLDKKKSGVWGSWSFHVWEYFRLVPWQSLWKCVSKGCGKISAVKLLTKVKNQRQRLVPCCVNSRWHHPLKKVVTLQQRRLVVRMFYHFITLNRKAQRSLQLTQEM